MRSVASFVRNAEIANGRLAMMAIIGMFFQDKFLGLFHTDVRCRCLCRS